MRQVAHLVATGALLLAAFFVWTTLRSERTLPQFSRPPHGEYHRVQPNHVHDDELDSRPARASIIEKWTSTATAHSQRPSFYTSDSLHESLHDGGSSGFAYAFYATSDQYACSVLVNIHRLQRVLQCQYPIHVLVSTHVSAPLVQAMKLASAHVHVEKPPPLASAASPSSGGYYQDCLLKLLAFKLHRLSPGLERVLVFDADQLVIRNLDDLFAGLPKVDLAAPRAYWLAKDFLASTFMMIQLSDRLWASVGDALEAVGHEKFDMDLVNDLLGGEVLMLPGEYVTLNSHWEDWNLPSWYHPKLALNMTTVNRMNEMAQQARLAGAANEPPTLSSSNPPALNTSTNATNRASMSSPATVLPSISSSLMPTPVKPRFPEGHPISKELVELEKAAAVIHFSAVGKPWAVTEEILNVQRPDAHPALGNQFHAWREVAAQVCPAGL